MGDDGCGSRPTASGCRCVCSAAGVQRVPEGGRIRRDWLSQIGIEVKVKIVSEDTLYEKVGNGDFDMFEWGWVVEPDPDYQLSTFTCDQRSTEDDGTIFAGLSDSFYCDAEYDKLYQEQKLETDQAKRAEIVKAMQQMLYDSNAYVVTVYYDNPTAYRSDRWTNFTPQPSRTACCCSSTAPGPTRHRAGVRGTAAAPRRPAVASTRALIVVGVLVPSGWCSAVS